MSSRLCLLLTLHSNQTGYTNIANNIAVTPAKTEVTKPIFLLLNQPDKPIQAISENRPNAIDKELVRVPKVSVSIATFS